MELSPGNFRTWILPTGLLPVESWTALNFLVIVWQNSWNIANQRISLVPWCPKFVVELGHTDLVGQPHSPATPEVWLITCHIAGLSGEAKDTHAKTLLLVKTFQGLRGYFPGAKGKGQPLFGQGWIIYDRLPLLVGKLFEVRDLVLFIFQCLVPGTMTGTCTNKCLLSEWNDELEWECSLEGNPSPLSCPGEWPWREDWEEVCRLLTGGWICYRLLRIRTVFNSWMWLKGEP